jgi:hypothetical protein
MATSIFHTFYVSGSNGFFLYQQQQLKVMTFSKVKNPRLKRALSRGTVSVVPSK